MTNLERKIIEAKPVAKLIEWSKAFMLPPRYNIALYDLVVHFLWQINKVGLYDRAAAISFNLITAFPATLLFVFSVIPYLPSAESFENEILLFFKDITPNSVTYIFIKNLLEDLLKKEVGLFSFGFVLITFYASNAMLSIIKTFDKSVMETKPKFYSRRLRAIKLTAILLIVVIASATVLIGQEQLAFLLKSIYHLKKRAKLPWWNTLRWAILVLSLLFGLSTVYKYGPSVKKRGPFFSIGSVVATFTFVITTAIFSYWVNHFASYNKVYGPIGTVLVILMLIYVNSLILIIGFEINVCVQILYRRMGIDDEDESKKKGPKVITIFGKQIQTEF